MKGQSRNDQEIINPATDELPARVQMFPRKPRTVNKLLPNTR
jgi:hypothetical protein